MRKQQKSIRRILSLKLRKSHEACPQLSQIYFQFRPLLGAKYNPCALLERIIKTATDEGDIVLDPFCGCGTTLVAAQKLVENGFALIYRLPLAS